MNQRMIAAPWGTDVWAENWERIVAAEAKCYKFCEYVKTCPNVGLWYDKYNCALRQDEENSR